MNSYNQAQSLDVYKCDFGTFHSEQRMSKRIKFLLLTNRVILLYVIDGHCALISETLNQELHKGTLIFLSESGNYSMLFEDICQCSYYFLEFSRITHLLNYNLVQNSLLNIGLNNELADLFIQISNIFSINPNTNKIYQYGLIGHMLGLISYESQTIKEVNHGQQLIESAKIVILENLHTDIRAEDVALKLRISYSRFRKLFKLYSGYSPGYYIKQMKINKSQRYLIETNLSIKEISYLLGYSSLESFVISFKNSTGITPSNFRKNQHQ